MKCEGDSGSIASSGIGVGAKRLHHIAAEDIAFLVLREGYGYLSATVGVAAVVSHATQRRRNVTRVGAGIFRRKGDIRLLFRSPLCGQGTNGFAISAVQPHLVPSVLRKGDSLSAATLQSVSNIIGEATAIGLRVRRADSDRHNGRSTPGAVFARVETIGGERMSDQRFCLKVLPTHAASIQTMGYLIR